MPDLTSAGTVTGQEVTATGQFTAQSTVLLSGYDCSTYSNGGALTTDSQNVLRCSNDDTSAGGGNSFETIAVPAGTNPVADSSTDTLTITETSFLTITGTAGTDTIDITQVTTDLGTDGLIAANAVALSTDTTGNYVAEVADGTGIDGTAAAEGATYTPTFDATELEALTWGAGGNASNAWTFNLSGTDPVITMSSNTITVTGDIAASGIAGPDITVTPTGGVAFGIHGEAQGANTLGYLKNGTRYVLMESPTALWIGTDGGLASTTPYIMLKTDGTGDGEIQLPTDSIGTDEVVGGLVRCGAIENLAAADDNFPMGSWPKAVTMTSVWCHCYGTCTTSATIQLEDDAGNAMTGTATCDTGGGAATAASITAGGALVAYEGLRFDVTNAVSPETDEYAICASYS